MAGFQAEEGDSGSRLDRGPADLAARAVEARGHVDGDHAPAGPGEDVDPLDDRPRLPLDVARQPRAKDRVDDAVGVGEVDARRGRNFPWEARGRDRRVAAERLAPPEEAELDGIAALGEDAPGDEAVAAVVARPAQNRDPSPRRRDPRHLVRDREAGRLHQPDPRRSGRNGHAIRLAHLGGGQKIGQVQRIEHDGKVGVRNGGGKRQKRVCIASNSAISPASADPR